MGQPLHSPNHAQSKGLSHSLFIVCPRPFTPLPTGGGQEREREERRRSEGKNINVPPSRLPSLLLSFPSKKDQEFTVRGTGCVPCRAGFQGVLSSVLSDDTSETQSMDTAESCVPPGFRFHPTDEELVGYYLKKKVASEKIDLDVIRDIDLYRIEPWDLQERCRIGYEEQTEWYFFSHKDKKYPTGTRTNRATMAGFWKATGRDKAVYDKGRLIGMRKTLVFYKGRAPNGQKTDWIMHEYRLESEENAPPQEEGWVVCRAFKKRTAYQTRAADVWESAGYVAYDEPSAVSTVVDPADYRFARRPQDCFCKQETEPDSLSFLQANPFMQLPQLESPSVPLPKRPSLLSLASEYEEEEYVRGSSSSSNNAERVTDWRALDKFVASQLSQEERFDGESAIDVGVHDGSDMAALLLLQNGAEGSKLNEFLGTGSECDIGICIFEK
ncbi:hypothetical protein Taro_028777 [Colocasia esculenta]|uniref:NAC domain-containing protein n=1 Tax=Colocasia esculenta TaxID=4460 RepID=A0A843VP55_COLES|nr:hypothetical protein [Colocasia esculenta]